MNTLKMSGGMATINNGFRAVSPDSRVQAIIIGFMFVSFIEGAAGFGHNGGGQLGHQFGDLFHKKPSKSQENVEKTGK